VRPDEKPDHSQQVQEPVCAFLQQKERHIRGKTSKSRPPLPPTPSGRGRGPKTPVGAAPLPLFTNGREEARLLKNSPASASGPLFSPNGTTFEAFEPELGPSMDLQPTFSTGSGLLGNRASDKEASRKSSALLSEEAPEVELTLVQYGVTTLTLGLLDGQLDQLPRISNTGSSVAASKAFSETRLQDRYALTRRVKSASSRLKRSGSSKKGACPTPSYQDASAVGHTSRTCWAIDGSTTVS
jgi:hypothetical protein